MQRNIIAQLSAWGATLSSMIKIGDIHVFEDREFLHSIKRDSMLVFEAGIVAGVLWTCAMTALRELGNAPFVPFELGDVLGSWGLALMGVSGEASPNPAWWISLAAAIAGSLVLHELVHAFFFKKFAPPGAHVSFGANLKAGMIYATAGDILYTRSQYEIIVLAPTFVVTLLVIALGLGLSWPLWTLIVAVVHLSGCTGDWGYVHALRRDPSITHCRDTEWGVEFYRDAPVRASRPNLSVAPAQGDVPRQDDAVAQGDEAAQKRSGFSVVDGGKSS